MIKSIKCINYKSFNNLDLHNIYFKKVNLIFGYNGKGKSSFVNFIKENIDNISDNISCSEDKYNFFIYDELYKRNSLYINDDEQTGFSNFYLGNNILQIIKEKEEIEKSLSELNEAIEEKKIEISKINSNIDNLKIQIAKNTKKVLYYINPDKYKSNNSYTKTHINNTSFDNAISLDNDEFELSKKYTMNNILDEIILFEFTDMKNIFDKIDELCNILKETPENNAIDRFKNDKELENFARIAIQLKNKYPEKYNEKCPLCEQNIIKINLWENLENHFNKEYADFINKLMNIKNFFISITKELEHFENWLNKNFVSTKLILSKNIDVDQLRNKYLTTSSFINDNLDIIIKKIDNKIKSPNSSNIILELDDKFSSNLNEIINDNDIDKIIELHNIKQKEYNSVISKNEEKIKIHFIAQEKELYFKYKNDIKELEDNIDDIETDIEDKLNTLDSINNELEKSYSSFQVLNNDLQDWFFPDIRFYKISSNHYKTQRKNCDDKWMDCKSGLSEGEKTIISLIYFINFYISNLYSSDKFPILIIDDPINSLDYHNKDKICNYILYKIFNNLKGQIFILSHDKDFLIKINKELNKKINDKNYSFLKNDDKIILSIEKENLVSKIKTLKNIKNYNEVRDIYNELKKYIENPDLNLDNDKMNLPRMFLEKIFAICFDNDKNFTDCYDTFISIKKLPKKYTADDIQNLNHNKNDSDLSAEAREKCKFVIDIFEKCFNIEVDNE